MLLSSKTRLMHLLDRSKFYANFLLQRMASKKEEEKLKVILWSECIYCFIYLFINHLSHHLFNLSPARKVGKEGSWKEKHASERE